jgi:hypothetical protein
MKKQGEIISQLSAKAEALERYLHPSEPHPEKRK